MNTSKSTMTLLQLIKAVRRKTISECQRAIVNNPDDDRHYISAKLSDMKLYTPDAEINNLIKEYQNGTETRCPET